MNINRAHFERKSSHHVPYVMKYTFTRKGFQGFSKTSSFVNVCLIGETGQALWFLYHSSENRSNQPVQFWGDDIGSVQFALVSPEENSWDLKELQLNNDLMVKSPEFEGNTVGFVPAKSIVVKNNEHAILFGLEEYKVLKNHILKAMATSVGIGAALAGIIAKDAESVGAFALGGLISVLYQSSLQRDVDNFGKEGNEFRAGLGLIGRVTLVGMIFAAVHPSPDMVAMMLAGVGVSTVGALGALVGDSC